MLCWCTSLVLYGMGRAGRVGAWQDKYVVGTEQVLVSVF